MPEDPVGAYEGEGDPTARGTATLPAPPQPGEMAAPMPTLPATVPQIPLEQQQTLELPKESFGHKLYHGILNALGGSQDTSFARDPATGKMTVTSTPSTPGSQWKRIISGALTGFAGAQAAGTMGPGGAMRGLAGGIKAGEGLRERTETKQRGEADEDYKANLERKTSDLRNAQLSQQTAESQWRVQQGNREAEQNDVDRYNAAQQIIQAGGPGTEDMGVFNDFSDYIAHAKDNPQAHTDAAEGRLFAIPNISGDGKKHGIQVWRVTPDWENSRNTKPVDIPTRNADGTWTTQTIPPQGATNGHIQQWLQSGAIERNKEELDKQKQTAQENLWKSEAAQHYAAAEKDRREAAILSQANDQQTIQSNARQIYEGSMDPANLSKRAKSYDATLAAANAMSMQETGHPFDIAKAAGDYKYATNPQTYNTLNYLNSLTGRDNASGNLGEIISLSDKLGRSQFPALNSVEQWAKISAGHDDVAAYRAGLVEVSDQIAKVLQGGGTGNATSDRKLEQAQSLLNQNFNAQQIRGVALELRQLLGNRKKEIIGDNRYLVRWQGAPQQTGGGGQNKLPGAGQSISLAKAKLLPQYEGKTDVEISEAAQALGYTVTK